MYMLVNLFVVCLSGNASSMKARTLFLILYPMESPVTGTVPGMQETFEGYLLNERIITFVVQKDCENGLQGKTRLGETNWVASVEITQAADMARRVAMGGTERFRDRKIFRRENQEAGWRAHSLSQKTQEEICRRKKEGR